MKISENGEFIFSCAVGDRFITQWSLKSSKKSSPVASYTSDSLPISISLADGMLHAQLESGLIVLHPISAKRSKVKTVPACVVIELNDPESKQASFLNSRLQSALHVLTVYGTIFEPTYEIVV